MDTKKKFFSVMLFCFTLVCGYGSSASSKLAQGRCSRQVGLGKVTGVTLSPTDAKEGDQFTASISVRTSLPPSGSWNLMEVRSDGVSVFPVPEFGTIRSSLKREPQSYTFTLHFDSYEPDLKIYFDLVLAHPCNSIMINGELERWQNASGMDLPTVLHVPEDFVDLSHSDSRSTLVGVEVDLSKMELEHAFWYANGKRRGDTLYMTRSVVGSRVFPFDWRPVSGKTVAPRQGQKIEGQMIFHRETIDKEEGVDAYVLHFMCQVKINGARNGLTLGIYVQIILRQTTAPAVGIIGDQYTERLRHTRGYYNDTNGKKIIPLSSSKGSRFPNLVRCWSVASSRRPYIAFARVSDDSFSVIETFKLKYGLAVVGKISVTAYEIPAPVPGEAKNYMCSAESNGMVASLPFEVLGVQDVVVSSENPTNVARDNDTFKNGYKFTCRATGFPPPKIVFYQLGRYDWFNPSQLNSLDYLESIKTSGRFTVNNNPGGESTLAISPGGSPNLINDDFKLVCLGFNKFAEDIAYVDFTKLS